MAIFESIISGPIFIGIVLIYSLCITVYFIFKKNKTSLNNVEGTFGIKSPPPLILAAIFIGFLTLNSLFQSNNLISFFYFLLPTIFILVLIVRSSKLILRNETLEAYKLKCSYSSIQHIDFYPNSNDVRYNLKITVNNKIHTIIIQAKDKDTIKEILDSKTIKKD